MEEQLRRQAAGVRFLLVDADGVLTDGRIGMAPDGGEWKSFDARDGLGIRLAQKLGIGVGVLSGRRSEAVWRRARELDFDEIHQGVMDKIGVFEGILSRRGLTAGEVAYVGDDLVDIPVMCRVGLACSVPDAPEEVRRSAHLVTVREGGRGAVREVIEFLLKARGVWDQILSDYDYGSRA